MAYRIEGLNPSAFDRLFALSDAELAAEAGARVVNLSIGDPRVPYLPPRPTPVAALVPNATAIGNTGVNLAPGLAILAQSAGEEVGDFAHIWVNGVDYANNQRGYNLVALTPTGELLASATFDTMQPPEATTESTRMAEWLNRWGNGTVIVGAAADSVATEDQTAWDANVIAALQRSGIAGDLRGKLRWSHAFIGVVGAPPASALEEMQLIRPAAIWLGVPLPATAGYGPLQSMTLTRN